jgi:S1-C subfamily serine protease
MTHIRTILSLLAGLALALLNEPATAQSTKPPGPIQRPHFAPSFGITYRLVPYGRSYGAQLVQNPVLGTGADRAGLQRGDIVVFLDDQPIYAARDVVRHGGKIVVTYVDFHSGKLKSATTILPPRTGRYPPPEPPAPYVLGVSVSPVTLTGADVPPPEPGADPAAPPPVSVGGLRIDGLTFNSAARQAGLESGDVILQADEFKTLDTDSLRQAIQVSRGVLKLKVQRAEDKSRVDTVTVHLQPA